MTRPLPLGWTWCRLDDLVANELHAITDGPFGSSLKTADYVEGGAVRVIRLGNLGVGRFIDEDTAFVSEEKFAALRKHEANPGDLVIAALADPVGRCVEVPAHLGPAIVKADCIRVRVGEGVDRRYLLYALNSPDGLRRAKSAAHGMGRLRMNLGDVRALPVPLPPLAEQKRIVAKLEELTARSRRAKEALDAVPPLLDQLRQSILAAAFRGDLTADWRAKNPDVEPAASLLKNIRTQRRLTWETAQLARMIDKGRTPTTDRWKERYAEPESIVTTGLPALPRGWAWASWREVGISQNGRPFPSSEYQTTGVRLLRPGNLHVSGAVSWEPANTRCLPESFAEENPDLVVGPGEIIMNLTAQSLKDEFLGRVCLSGPGERSLLNQRLARLTPVGWKAELMLWMFKSPLIRSYVDSLNSGSLIQHMFTSQVDEFALPIPPLAEQHVLITAIGVAMQRLEAVAVRVCEALDRQHELDTSLLAKALRGELVPQDPSEISAADLLERVADLRDPTAGAPPEPHRRTRNGRRRV